MEFVAIGGTTILSGGEDEKVAVSGNRDVWKLPLGELIRVIGEVVSIEADRASVGIVKFDPVGSFVVFILQAGGVGIGEEFVNTKRIANDSERESLLDGKPGEVGAAHAES